MLNRVIEEAILPQKQGCVQFFTNCSDKEKRARDARSKLRPIGFEPTTTRLGRGDSASELRAYVKSVYSLWVGASIGSKGELQFVQILHIVR